MIHRRERYATVMPMAVDVDARTEKSNFDAMEAVREGDVDGVRIFLERGGEVNLCSVNTERTLLHVACRQGYAEMVVLLLSHGANPEATTLRHLSPLHLAAHEGHLNVSRLLLEAWAPVDDRDRAGNTPLHLAAQKGHIDVIRLLLQCGADKDGVEENGWAALHFAVWQGHTGVARMLLQAGVNAKVCDRYDKSTPLHLACSFGHAETARLLVDFEADSSAIDERGALPDHVIGASCPDGIDPALARELSEIVVGHRAKLRGRHGSSSLECVVDSLRAKVCELEDQIARAGRDRLELVAYAGDANHHSFSAALKPECPICQVEVKEAVLDPCRHLAACSACAESLQGCPFCAGDVHGYEALESREAFARMRALEDEREGLRTQLERFSSRVRELVTANGDLKLQLRSAKADTAVLTEECQALEERLFTKKTSPPPAVGDVTADSDCGSATGDICIPLGLAGSGVDERVQSVCQVIPDADPAVRVQGGSRKSSTNTTGFTLASVDARREEASRYGRQLGSLNSAGSNGRLSINQDAEGGRKPDTRGVLPTQNERSSIVARCSSGGGGNSGGRASVAGWACRQSGGSAVGSRGSAVSTVKSGDSSKHDKDSRDSQGGRQGQDRKPMAPNKTPTTKPVGQSEGGENSKTASYEPILSPARLERLCSNPVLARDGIAGRGGIVLGGRGGKGAAPPPSSLSSVPTG